MELVLSRLQHLLRVCQLLARGLDPLGGSMADFDSLAPRAEAVLLELVAGMCLELSLVDGDVESSHLVPDMLYEPVASASVPYLESFLELAVEIVDRKLESPGIPCPFEAMRNRAQTLSCRFYDWAESLEADMSVDQSSD